MINKGSKSILTIMKGSKVIQFVYKGALLVYQAIKDFIVSGVFPLTLRNTIESNLTNYKIEGNSVQDGTPSPDNPIEIQNVGDKTNNILPFPYMGSSTTVNGATLTINSDSSITASGTPTGYIGVQLYGGELIKSSTNKLTLSIYGDAENTNVIANLQDSDGNYLYQYVARIGQPITIEYDKYPAAIRLDIAYRRHANNKEMSGTAYIMVNEGTEALPYEPYGKYKIPVKAIKKDETYVEPIITNIYLDEPLRKAGIYADYIDYKNQKVVRNISSVDLGTLTWALRKDTTGYFIAHENQVLFRDDYGNNIFTTELSNLVCTGLKVASPSNLYYKKCTIPSVANYILNSRTAISAYYEGLDGNVDEFAKVVNGIILYYVLETPIEETIELPSIPTLKGTTILDSTVAIQPSNVEVEYTNEKLQTGTNFTLADGNILLDSNGDYFNVKEE